MSDQDFFFDEEEKPAAKQAASDEKPAPKKPAPKPVAKGTAAKTAAPAAASGGIELTWTVTTLIGVVALLLGVIVGYSIPKNSPTTGTANSGTAVQQAPQLTPEQMSGGELPPGHPDIGAQGGAPSGAATGSTTPTGN